MYFSLRRNGAAERIKNPFCLIIIQQSMSAIIDGQGFADQQQEESGLGSQTLSLAGEISKKVSSDAATLLIASSGQGHRAASRLHFRGRDFLLRVATQRDFGVLAFTVCETGGEGVRRERSEVGERETLMVLQSSQFAAGGEVAFYLREGRVCMEVKVLFAGTPARRRPFIDFYNRLIHKNMVLLHVLLGRVDPRLRPLLELAPNAQFYEQLALTRLMHGEGSFDFSEQRMEFKQSQAVLKQQRLQLRSILENIIIENALERGVDCLFQLGRKGSGAGWLRNNLTHLSAALNYKYKDVFQLPRVGERRIDDFVFNTVAVELRDRMAKPVAEGGSSLIFLAKATLSFLPAKGPQPPPASGERAEKLLAVKILKTGAQGGLRRKLQHQQRIVARMHGGCCYFLPKYYGPGNEAKLGHCLLMEYVNGEPLDAFAKSHRVTISLRTKLYLLFNVVLGMRFLVSREIVHLDLKPSNIVVCRQLIPKIMDFGEAYHRELCPRDYAPGFTFPYAAPEVFIHYQNRLLARQGKAEGRGVDYSEKQDVFAFGVIMHEMFLNSSLFTLDAKGYRQLYRRKDITERIFLSPERLHLYGEGVVMEVIMFTIGRCLDPDPARRPKFDWLGVLLKLLLNYFNAR